MDLGGGAQAKIKFFLNMVMLHIKLKGMATLMIIMFYIKDLDKP